MSVIVIRMLVDIGDDDFSDVAGDASAEDVVEEVGVVGNGSRWDVLRNNPTTSL